MKGVIQMKFDWLIGTCNDRFGSRLLFQAEIFQEFVIKEDLVGFQVNLTVLTDCLNIFGGTTVPGKEMKN